MTELTVQAQADAAVRTFQTACQTADVDLLMTVLAPDAVFRSPLTMRTTFTGHDEIRDLMAAALTTLQGIDYHTELLSVSRPPVLSSAADRPGAGGGEAATCARAADLGDHRTRALVSTAKADGEDIEEVALLRFDEQARIVEITLWVRPLPGATALMNGVGPRLLRRLGRHRMAAVLPVLSKPLGFLVRFADRQAVGMLRRK